MADVILVLGITPTERLREFVDAVNRRDIGSLLQLVASLSSEGRDFRQFLQDAVSVYRDLAVLRLDSNLATGPGSSMLSRLSPEEAQALASRLGLDECLYVIEKLARIDTELKTSTQPSITLEVGLIELVESVDSRVDVSQVPDLQSLSRRLAVLERQVAQLIRRAGSSGLADSVAASSADDSSQGETRDDQSPCRAETDDKMGERDSVDSQGEAGSGLTITDQNELDRLFHEILDGVRARSVPLFAVLREGRPAFLRNDVLVIGFPQQYCSFHMGRGMRGQEPTGHRRCGLTTPWPFSHDTGFAC